jgi:hypothetical protein
MTRLTPLYTQYNLWNSYVFLNVSEMNGAIPFSEPARAIATAWFLLVFPFDDAGACLPALLGLVLVDKMA